MSPHSNSIDWSDVFPIYFGIESDAAYAYVLFREEEVAIPMDGGVTIRGWFLNRGAGVPLVVMYAGNGMNVGEFHRFARQDTSKSYLLLNYRGYGRSEGEPTEEGIVADSLQAIEWAKSQLGADTKVILFAYSIGTGVAMQVAARQQPDAMILICPFARRATGEFTVFCSDEAAPHLTCPVTIMAATEDSLVLPDSTKALIAAFTQIEPTVYWFYTDHNSILSGCDFRTQVKATLAQYQ